MTTHAAFVEYKDEKDLHRRFAIPFGMGERRYVDVYIWKSVRGLRRNTYFRHGDYLGAYVANPYRTRRGMFGELHLVKRMIGAGYVAHEVQHFLYDWLLEQAQNGRTNERMAKLAGEITRRFWNEFLGEQK